MLLVIKIQGEFIWLDAVGFCHIVKLSAGEGIFRSTMVHTAFSNYEEKCLVNRIPAACIQGNKIVFGIVY